jgi:hypothetical protein
LFDSPPPCATLSEGHDAAQVFSDVLREPPAKIMVATTR